MSRAPIYVSDLEIGNHIWKMGVRVHDLWTVKEKNGSLHVELILQDAKENKIQVITRPRDFNHWMQVLKEQDTYTLYNGEPLKNDIQLKACHIELKLLFNSATTLCKTTIPEIPTHMFDFKDISDFLGGKYKLDLLYDVIGILHEVTRKQVAGNNKKACANIALSDYHGNIIDLVLWDAFAAQLFAFMNSSPKVTPTILVLTHGWCKPNAASGKPMLSNAWSGSKLIINSDHPQVISYRTRLGSYQPCTQTSQTMSQQSDYDTFWTNTKDFKTISEIKEKHQECYCTTIGMTMRFKTHQSGWYYNCCSGCSRGVKNPHLPFECDCGGLNIAEVSKYKLEIEVEYQGKSCVFMFWDKDCVPIIGMTASKLRAIMNEAGEDHPQIYPTYLDVLLKKKLTFRVKYSTSYGQCSIVQLNPDKDVYQRIADYFNPNEHTSKVDPVKTSNVPGMQTPKASSLQNVFVSPGAPVIKATPVMKTLIQPIELTMSETSSTSTPSKRDADSIGYEETSPMKFLTPKNSATKLKHMKKE